MCATADTLGPITYKTGNGRTQTQTSPSRTSPRMMKHCKKTNVVTRLVTNTKVSN